MTQRLLALLLVFSSLDLACSSTTTTSGPQPSAADAAAPSEEPDAEAPLGTDAGTDASPSDAAPAAAQLIKGLPDKSCTASCAAAGLTCATTCEALPVDERLSNDAPYAGYGAYQKLSEPVTSLPRTRGEHSCDAPIEEFWSHGGDSWRLQLYSSATPRVSCCCR